MTLAIGTTNWLRILIEYKSILGKDYFLEKLLVFEVFKEIFNVK